MFTGFFGVIKLAMLGFFLLGFTFLILLALPRSPLRDFALQAMLWGITAVCALIVVTPFDPIPIPFFPFDDILALGGGLLSAATAILQKASQRRADREAQQRELLYMQARAAYETAHVKTKQLHPVIEGEFHESPTR